MKNVLFLVADDQRFDTIGALGNPEIKTPNLDRLVERGTSFTEAFIPGGTSGAVCMPSRAMIHTGRFLTDFENCGESIPADYQLLGEVLKENGYQTCGIGKWHNGPESYARSFTDGEEIFFGGMWDHWNVPVNHFDPQGKYDQIKHFTQDPFSSKRGIDLPSEKITLGKHSTDLFADAIIEKIQAQRQEEKPFFIYGSFLAPHDPRTMPQAYQEMYDPEKITLPPNFLPEHPFGFDIRGERDETLAPYPRTEQEIRQHLADYYGMISHLDARIGDILQELERQNLLEETVIIFTGDNGLSIGQHGLMGKQNLYDASIRVPLLFAGPNVPENNQVAGKCLLLDIFPTILDLLELPSVQGIHGKSLVPQMQGVKSGRDSLFLMFTTKIRGLLTEEYKYLEYRSKDGRFVQLFDRKNDPYEITNLSFAPQYREVVTAMQNEMRQQAQKHRDLVYSQGREYWQKEVVQG